MLTTQFLSALLASCVWLSVAKANPPAASTPQELSKIAGWKGTAPKSESAFTFVVLSDRTGGAKEGAWAFALGKVNLLQPDFVICVGDLIQGYTEDQSAVIQQWEEFEALIEKLQAPFFYCPGNHDLTHDWMVEIYRKRHGVKAKSYYSFDYRGCHFIVLDSYTAMRKESFADEQFAWLAKDLAAAKSAEHVFVFYHHDRLWNKAKLWNRLRAILPAGKTTIFNGHSHQFGFHVTDGIPTYKLSSTATKTGDRTAKLGRIQGLFRTFAHVAVNDGRPNIALLPVDEILTSSFGGYVVKVQSLHGKKDRLRALSPRGGDYTYRQGNPLEVPVTATAAWEAPGWTVNPPSVEFVVEPGQVLEEKFLLTPQAAVPLKPKLLVTYKFTDGYLDQVIALEGPVEPSLYVELGTYAEMEIPRIADAAVDGKLDEYSGVTPLLVGHSSRIYTGLKYWSGPADSSFELHVAIDGERLFVAVDVTDDQIYIEDARQPWLNDAMDFYWDGRAPEKRDGRHGEGTGHLTLVVPPVGARPKLSWSENNKANPEGLVAACKRRKGGYVYEFSIPLRELGVKVPRKPGQEFRMELRLDDGDITNSKATSTRMTTSGLGRNYWFTSSYIRCTFK